MPPVFSVAKYSIVHQENGAHPNNQFLLEKSAYLLSFRYVILTKKRDGKPVRRKPQRMGTGWNLRSENQID